MRTVDKINRRLRTSPRRVAGLYSNILAGIITGACIGAVVPYFSLNWILFFALAVLFLGVGFRIGLWALKKITSNNKDLVGYASNFLAGIFASVYVSILLSVNMVGRTVLIGISTIGLIILLYVIAKRRSEE